jgi:hypothetical protein
MNNNLNWSLILPAILILAQTLLFISLAVWLCKKTKLLDVPVDELQISTAVAIGSLIFGVIIVSTASIEALLHSYAIQNNGIQVYTFSNVFSRFGQFFFIVLCCEMLFLLISWFASNLFLEKGKASSEIKEGNIAVAILYSVIIIAFSIMCLVIAKNICDILIPVTLNFR